MKSVVSLSQVLPDESVQDAVIRTMDRIDWKNVIPRGSRVSLKPNLGFDLFYPGSTTSPDVVEGVIRAIYDYVDEIFIVENDQVLVDIEKGYRNMRIDRLVKQYAKVSWVNLSAMPWKTVPVPGANVISEIRVPEILADTLLVTIPVMKTHDKTTITGAIKNQWGCIEKLRHQYHLVIHQALEDISRVFTPALAVMDGTVCLEGNGPKSGIPRICDLVLASTDFVALDATAARIMGYDPEKISHICRCARAIPGAVRKEDIDVVGDFDQLPQVPFKDARHNLVSVFELLLRKSAVKWLFFDTPVFQVCCLLSRMYYYVWYVTSGYWKAREILATRYGPQFLDDPRR